jgi:hypothetical protein
LTVRVRAANTGLKITDFSVSCEWHVRTAGKRVTGVDSLAAATGSRMW